MGAAAARNAGDMLWLVFAVLVTLYGLACLAIVFVRAARARWRRNPVLTARIGQELLLGLALTFTGAFLLSL